MIPFGVMFLVLRSMYQNRSVIHSYTSGQMIFYYFMVVLISGMSSTHFEGWRIEEIRRGQIDVYLLRPFSYLKEILLNDLAGKLLYILLFTPIYIGFYFLAQSILPFTLPTFTATTLLLFIFFIIFAYVVEMCIGISIVLLGFWFEGSQGLEHFKWISITLLSGSMIPLEFLPPWLKNITARLPFQYMYAFPINLIQGRATFSLSDFAIILISCIVLFGLVTLLWKKALYTYTSSGG
ncbi:MAG: ABC-2 family transporter protein [Patescibacteria group bacterium]